MPHRAWLLQFFAAMERNEGRERGNLGGVGRGERETQNSGEVKTRGSRTWAIGLHGWECSRAQVRLACVLIRGLETAC